MAADETVSDVEVVVVGGGPAGLSTAGALKAAGIDAVVLDQDDRIGGSWARRYERLHLHTVRAFSSLAHFPIPRRFPRYMSKDMYARYLQSYAEHFGLNCTLNSRVRKVSANGGGTEHGFIVETERATWRSRVVVIAAGQFGAPLIPRWPGLEDFAGEVRHSAGYQSGRAFVGRRVLVIGAGNSGAEIAVDLAEQGAAFVALSVRTPPPVVPRDFLLTPVQVFGILLSRVPARIADRIGAVIARVALGDLTRHGLRRAAWQPFTAKRIPIIDVGLVDAIKRGQVHVRDDVAGFARTGVTFADGREEAFDVVIAATGFTTGLERWVDVPGVLDANGFPKGAHGEPTGQPGLFFMGYLESHRGHLFEFNIASRRLAKTIKAYLSAGGAVSSRAV